MKLKLTCLIAVLLTCAVHALTCAWNAPRSWTGPATTWLPGVTGLWLIQADAGMSAEAVYASKGTDAQITVNEGDILNFGELGDILIQLDAEELKLQENKYFYVVFETAPLEGKDQYMVASSAQYTGTTGKDGFYNTQAEVNQTPPDMSAYVDLTTIGGTWKAATPEPTALALLVLGMAGFALRRKV